MLMKVALKELSMDLNWTAQITCPRWNKVKQMVWFEETGGRKKQIIATLCFLSCWGKYFYLSGVQLT